MQNATSQISPAKSSETSTVRWLSLPNIFVTFTLFFGSALAILTPPFQVPDEQAHLQRAYQISDGVLIPKFPHNRGGGELPASINEVSAPFADVLYGSTTSKSEILKTLKIPLRPDVRIYYEFANTTSYSPLGYLPQVGGILLGRVFHATALELMYLARLGNLLLWAGMGFCAMNVAPTFRRPIFLLMLMPMPMYLAASMSQDVTCNAVAVLWTAMIWREAVERSGPPEQPVSRLSILSFFIAAIAVGLLKFVYLPLLLLVLLIPSRRLGGNWRRLALTAAVTSSGFIAQLLWAVHTPGLDNADMRVFSPRQQLHLLLHNPSAWISLPWKTLCLAWQSLAISFVGRFGWSHTPVSGVFCAAYLAALVWACRPSGQHPKIRALVKWIVVILAAAVASALAMGLTAYLFWNYVGSDAVLGLQGRYLIPIAPATMMLIYVLWQRVSKISWSARAERTRNLACALIAAAGLAYALHLVFIRFYILGSWT